MPVKRLGCADFDPTGMASVRFRDHTATTFVNLSAVDSTLILIVAALGALALLVVLLAVLASRRSGKKADERVGAVVRSLEQRMDELAGELAGAVARAEEESRRSRFLGEIAGSIDMDEVLGRTLEAGARLEGVDATLVRLDG